mgnify:CR=1 FL=1
MPFPWLQPWVPVRWRVVAGMRPTLAAAVASGMGVAAAGWAKAGDNRFEHSAGY